MNESTVPRELFSSRYSESQGLASDGDTLQRACVFSTTMKKKVNILMVDDELGKLLGYEAILSSLGQNLIRATSGAQALDRFGDGNPSCGCRRDWTCQSSLRCSSRCYFARTTD